MAAMNSVLSFFLFCGLLLQIVNSFVPLSVGSARLQKVAYHRSLGTSLRSDATPDAAPAEPSSSSKGFGKPKPAPTEKEEPKDAGTLTYESQAKRGVPEYNIFLRPSNGTEVEWVPVGSMTIPRDTNVGKAVYEVEDELLKGTFKLYPKLRAYYETRKEKDGSFEYGYCLKAFPDEEIKICKKPAGDGNKNFIQNWLGKLTNPMDTSDLKNNGEMTLKQ